MPNMKILGPTGLEIDLTNNEYFYFINMDSQCFFDSEIYSVKNIGGDGSTVNSVAVNPRSIKIQLRVKPGANVEEAKRYLLKCLKPKRSHTIYWDNDNLPLAIDGIFESMTMPRFSRKVEVDLSFYCFDPYWRDKENNIQSVDNVVATHYFTTDSDDMLYFDNDGDGITIGEYDFTLTRYCDNIGDVETGLTIEIYALDTATNPTIYLNEQTKYIGINDTLKSGDVVVITTEKGNKNIVKNGTSIINKIKQGSSFIQLELGTNTFTIKTDDENNPNLYYTISYQQKYV